MDLSAAMRAFCLAVLCLVLAGCRSAQPGPEPVLAPSEMWQRVSADSLFTFALPPNLEEQDVFGIDSRVGAYRGSSVRLSYDYGMWSSDLSRDDLSREGGEEEYSSRPVTIDGAATTLVHVKRRSQDRPEGFRYFTGVYFSKTPCRGAQRDALQMGAFCKSKADCEAMQKVFQSIEFLDHRCPSGPFELSVTFDEVHLGADSTRISGRVSLAGEEEPVAGATAYIAPSQSGSSLLGASTDSLGRFEMAEDVRVAETDSMFVSGILLDTKAVAVSRLKENRPE